MSPVQTFEEHYNRIFTNFIKNVEFFYVCSSCLYTVFGEKTGDLENVFQGDILKTCYIPVLHDILNTPQ